MKQGLTDGLKKERNKERKKGMRTQEKRMQRKNLTRQGGSEGNEG